MNTAAETTSPIQSLRFIDLFVKDVFKAVGIYHNFRQTPFLDTP